MLNDLAEAMKALDGKKKVSCGKSVVLFGVRFGPVVCCLLLLPKTKRKSSCGFADSLLLFLFALFVVVVFV